MPSTGTVHSMYAARGAELYDRIVAGDTSEVREIIRTIARGTDSVLELASGSGRLTIPLLRVARHVTAVDISADLTAMLRARVAGDVPLELVVADILAWDSEDRFDKVVLGTTSISLFDRADRARLFARVRRWLADDGSFVLSLRTPPLSGGGTVVHDIGGGLRIREVIDSERGTLSTTLTEDGDASEHTVRTYLLSRTQLVEELHAAGFAVTAEHPVRLRGHDDRIGDYAVLVASVSSPSDVDASLARGTSACLEFFLPPSRFGEIEAESAEGVTVSFSDGSTAIDAISGLWNVPLGYGNHAIADAVHQANLRASALPIFRRGSTYARRAAERLREYAGVDRYESVFFATSGSSALDAVVKLSRQVQKRVHGARRRRVVSLVGSYHGITSTAMALSGAYLYQDVYDVDERLHIKIPYDDVGALRRVTRRFGEEIAAIVMEPVLGSGALPLSPAMLLEVATLREQHGFLVVADEVATGFYRTGVRFASAEWPFSPDLLVLSKALTNGTSAASAVLLAPSVGGVLRRHDDVFWHGETQAGSPQSCAAILATLDELERIGAQSLADSLSTVMDEELNALASLSPRIVASGHGLMRALHLTHADGATLDASEVFDLVRSCLDDGVIVQPAPSSLQFMPALVFDRAQLAEVFARVRPTLERFLASEA